MQNSKHLFDVSLITVSIAVSTSFKKMSAWELNVGSSELKTSLRAPSFLLAPSPHVACNVRDHVSSHRLVDGLHCLCALV